MDINHNPIVDPNNAELVCEPGVTPMELSLGRQALEALHKYYPGWTWVCEIRGGMLIVRNLDCDPRGKMGFGKHITMLSGSNLPQQIMLAGGEFLERYKQKVAGRREGDALYEDMVFLKPEG